jgi:hypothetical protein
MAPTADGRFQCPNCPKSYIRRDYLRRHKNAKHSANPDYKCRENGCERSFLSKSHLDSHTECQHRHKCPNCEAIFTSHENLLRHRYDKHPKNIPVHVCEICSRTYDSEKLLKAHVKLHDKDRPRFNCRQCSKSYLDRRSLNQHMAEEHNEVSDRDNGSQVDREKMHPENSSQVDREEMHREKSPFFICPICNESYISKVSIQGHLERHDKDPPRFICRQCSNCYMDRRSLNQHMAEEHNEVSDHDDGSQADREEPKSSN